MSGHPAEPSRLEMAVDASLEDHLGAVEQSADAFLHSPGEVRKQALLATLEQLDVRLSAGDDYQSRVASSHLHYGYTGGYSGVFGQTDAHPIVEEMAGPELRAQIDLVKAAKELVRDASPHNLALLQSAQTSLERFRQSGMQ